MKRQKNQKKRLSPEERLDKIGFILKCLVATSWAVSIGLILSKVLLE